jgi:hypothetical protein
MRDPSRTTKLWRRLCVALVWILACGASGCSCRKTDEEILKERIDTTSVHLYLASKIAILKADQSPEAKKARDDLVAAMKALQGSKATSEGSKMTATDVLVLVKSLYSLNKEGKELLRSGNEKGMKPFLPVLFTPSPELGAVLDLNLEHAFLLAGLFTAKFHPDTKVPVPDEIALYEAWMTDPALLPLDGLKPLVRTMKAVLYANNELCDLAGKEGKAAEAERGKLDGGTLSAAFSTVNGSPAKVTDDQAKQTSAASRALIHGMTAVCYMKRDEGDDAKKSIDELDGFLQAADEMGIRSKETVFIRAYVLIQRGDRDGAKKALTAVRDDPTVDEATKKDLQNLIDHLADDGFIAGYFDRIFFVKTTTLIVLRRLDEAGVFDGIKQSELVKTIDGYLSATTQALAKAKEAVSPTGIKDSLKGLTEGK